MNNVAKKLALALLLSVPCMQATNTTGQSFYFGHQQVGTMKDVLGWNNQINLFGQEELSVVLKAQTEGGQNFSASSFAPYFTSNGTNTMVFGPAHNATTNATTDVFAINFLLSETFKSSVVFSPKITTWVTDFAAYVDLSNWCEGLHVRAHLPLQYLKQQLEMTETVSAAGGTTYGDEYIIDNNTTSVVYSNVVEAFVGDLVAGDVLQAWNYGKINGSQHNTKVSDITLSLGYNFLSSENYHLGLEFGGTFGAGGKSKAVYVFEPTFGNLGRSGVFGVVDGHAVLWNGENDDKQIAAYLNANVGYLFANNQVRSYDLTNFGDWSRYLLVKKITTVGTTGNSVYGGVDNMINIGTLGAKIGDYVTYDMSLLFDFQYNNFDFQLGYELAGHTKEKHKGFNDTIAANTYIVYAPQDDADNVSVAIGGHDAASAKGIEPTAVGSFGINGDITTSAPTYGELITGDLTVAVENSWLDVNSALAKTVISHAVVGAINYTWRDNDYVPCIGLYGKAEFDGHNHNTTDLWTVGLQGNVSF